MQFDALAFLAGCATGLLTAGAYLALLWIAVRRFVTQGKRDGAAWGLTLLRIGLLGGGIYLAMQVSLSALLGGGVGFLLGRTVILALARGRDGSDTHKLQEEPTP